MRDRVEASVGAAARMVGRVKGFALLGALACLAAAPWPAATAVVGAIGGPVVFFAAGFALGPAGVGAPRQARLFARVDRVLLSAACAGLALALAPAPAAPTLYLPGVFVLAAPLLGPLARRLGATTPATCLRLSAILLALGALLGLDLIAAPGFALAGHAARWRLSTLARWTPASPRFALAAAGAAAMLLVLIAAASGGQGAGARLALGLAAAAAALGVSISIDGDGDGVARPLERLGRIAMGFAVAWPALALVPARLHVPAPLIAVLCLAAAAGYAFAPIAGTRRPARAPSSAPVATARRRVIHGLRLPVGSQAG